MNTRRDEQDRVEVNPDILMGKPVITGTRIPVYLILNLLASGYTQERILKAYPGLAPEDLRAALQYAEQRMRFEEVYELPANPVPA
jgi:uncharacterized protein (DUF433 family)